MKTDHHSISYVSILSQLNYVIGKDKLAETIKRYFHDFKFKHLPNDIKRSAERVSELI
jgi:hypothetical protein